MPCYYPQSAYRRHDGTVTFSRSSSLSGERFALPCGQCVGCRLEKSRQWALRLLHEKKSWDSNCFVTLTYDNDHLPPGGTLVKRDLQLFMKRLRKSRPGRVRFYACGEYGELNGRPHYHAILFNCDFRDKLFCRSSLRGDRLYASEELRSLWPVGNNIIGDVTFESAAYVARYVLKKITGDRSDEHYAVLDGDGVVYDRCPEFAVMSRRPGIGAGYYSRFGQEVRDHDSVVVEGREVSPPRYYDARSKLIDERGFELNRRRRKRQAAAAAADNTVDRRRVKEKIAIRRLQEKERPI